MNENLIFAMRNELWQWCDLLWEKPAERDKKLADILDGICKIINDIQADELDYTTVSNEVARVISTYWYNSAR